jgi:hypothetical protein
VREGRAREIDSGLRAALDHGWSAIFITLTLQHGSRDPLAVTFERLRDGHRACHSGRVWTVLAKSLGYLGAIRAWEITHGINGFHPHAHEVLIFDRLLDDQEVAELKAHFSLVYGRRMAKLGLTVHPVHGIDVRRVETAGELAGYLTKVENGWGAGLELARLDLKKSRGKGSTPFELLADAAGGDLRARALFFEYEGATKGKRAITWSPGLRKRLLGVAEEDAPSDEDLAVLAPDADPVWGLDLPPRVWEEIRRNGGLADLLTVCEEEARRVTEANG